MTREELATLSEREAAQAAAITELFNNLDEGNSTRLREILPRLDNVNVQDKRGLTALHHIAIGRMRPSLRVMLADGRCDYLIKDHQGRYPYQLAVEWGRDTAMARLFVKKMRQQALRTGVEI